MLRGNILINQNILFIALKWHVLASKHMVFTHKTSGHINFMKQKELFELKKKKKIEFNSAMISLVHQHGRRFLYFGPSIWPPWRHMKAIYTTSCEDNLLETILTLFIQLYIKNESCGGERSFKGCYMDGRWRGLWFGRNNLFILAWSPITTNPCSASPTNT